jgi:hypothetical protein
MPRAQGQWSRYERLRRKYGIEFSGTVSPAEWSENHREEFLAIQSLGVTKYEDYAAYAKQNITSQPWKSRVLFLAKNVTERVARNECRNEATWRFSIEPLIFARLSADIAWLVESTIPRGVVLIHPKAPVAGNEFGDQKSKFPVAILALLLSH